MKTLKKQRIGLIVKSISLSVLIPFMVQTSVLPTPAMAGELELDDRLNAKLARHKARSTIAENTKVKEPDSEQGGGFNDEDECSSLDIGTIDEPKPGFATNKPQDIIITSDIINIDNKCKK